MSQSDPGPNGMGGSGPPEPRGGGPLDPSPLALVAIEAVLVVGTLSFGVVPLLVDGFVRLAHLEPQSAGLCITAEMTGQAVGAAGVLALVRRLDSRKLMGIALALITLGNGLSMLLPSFGLLLAARAVAGIGCGVSAAGIGLLAQTRFAERNTAIFDAASIVACAVLAALTPMLFHRLGMKGIFAALCGTAAASIFLLPAIPRVRSGPNTSSAAGLSLGRIGLTCLISGAYFVGVSTVWSYVGQIGAAHHMSVDAVSATVSRAWLVGGLAGSGAAIVIAKRLPRVLAVVVSAAGTAAFTCATVLVTEPGTLALALGGFAFFWLLSFPVQMGLFAQVDGTGRLAVVAFVVQLLACAAGPALGGLILQTASYETMTQVCVAAYVIYFCSALGLIRVGKSPSRAQISVTN